MPIKLLTEARKGRENSSAKRDSLFRPEDGYSQIVYNNVLIDIESMSYIFVADSVGLSSFMFFRWALYIM